jgi:hypothetical protein
MKRKQYILYEENEKGEVKQLYKTYSLNMIKHQKERFERAYKKKFKIMVMIK